MGDASGGLLPLELAHAAAPPTLVLVGGSSPDWMLAGGRALAEALPAGRLRVLAGAEHVVPPGVLVPVLAEFFVS